MNYATLIVKNCPNEFIDEFTEFDHRELDISMKEEYDLIIKTLKKVSISDVEKFVELHVSL